MKKRPLFATVALSAILAAGTALPALAAVEGDQSVDGQEQLVGQTNVKVLTLHEPEADEGAQLTVTIPLNMTVVADTHGGDLLCPTNYYIANNSANFDVKVTGTCEATGSGLNFNLTDDENMVGADKPWADGFDGNLYMTLVPTIGDGPALAAWNVADDEHEGWEIGAAKVAKVAVAGSTSKISKVLEVADNAPDSLVFTYTVEAVSDSK